MKVLFVIFITLWGFINVIYPTILETTRFKIKINNSLGEFCNYARFINGIITLGAIIMQLNSIYCLSLLFVNMIFEFIAANYFFKQNTND